MLTIDHSFVLICIITPPPPIKAVGNHSYWKFFIYLIFYDLIILRNPVEKQEYTIFTNRFLNLVTYIPQFYDFCWKQFRKRDMCPNMSTSVTFFITIRRNIFLKALLRKVLAVKIKQTLGGCRTRHALHCLQTTFSLYFI